MKCILRRLLRSATPSPVRKLQEFFFHSLLTDNQPSKPENRMRKKRSFMIDSKYMLDITEEGTFKGDIRKETWTFLLHRQEWKRWSLKWCRYACRQLCPIRKKFKLSRKEALSLVTNKKAGGRVLEDFHAYWHMV